MCDSYGPSFVRRGVRVVGVGVVVVLLAVIATGAITGTAAAQSAPAEEFNRSYGGSGFDDALSVVQTSDGGFALGGTTTSFGSGGAWLIKTDSDGNEQFNKTYENASASSVVQTLDGGFALVGRADLSGSDGPDAWLIKTDSGGNEQFNKTFGKSGFGRADRAFSVVQTSDRGFALAGQTRSFGSDTDAWLIKTDANGNEQFNKTFGGSNDDRAFSVMQTSDGGFALAGSRGPLEFGDAWLIKTDANGNVEINETFGGSGFDSARSVVQTSDGGFALGGVTTSFGSELEAWLVKTDSDGNKQFNKTYRGGARSVVQTSDGGFALGGGTESSGDTDPRLIKTDANGNEQFNETFDIPADDGASSLVQTLDGGFALASGSVVIERPSEEDDAWLIKVSDDSDPAPANFDVSIDSTNSPVEEGDTLTVTGTITNTGGQQDTQDIIASASGLGSITRTVALNGGESRTETVSVPTSAGDAGTYTVTVESENDTATTTVEVESDGGDDTFTDPLPGFNNPPQNTGELDPNLFEDIDGDGDGTDPTQTVTLWSELVVNPQAFDDLTQEQVDALDWNGDGQLTPADAVSLWTEQVLS